MLRTIRNTTFMNEQNAFQFGIDEVPTWFLARIADRNVDKFEISWKYDDKGEKELQCTFNTYVAKRKTGENGYYAFYPEQRINHACLGDWITIDVGKVYVIQERYFDENWEVVHPVKMVDPDINKAIRDAIQNGLGFNKNSRR